MTNKQRKRECKLCAKVFTESARDSNSQWELRLFCSASCSNKEKNPKVSIFTRILKYQVKKEGCWEWLGGDDGKGYGTISSRGGSRLSPEKAHRVSYEMAFGEIPKGLNVCHKCDNPPCTNPEHLFLGTQKDNAMDMVSKGRMNPTSFKNLNHQKKLSIQQVDEIRKLKFKARNGKGQGVTVKKISENYNVCVEVIRQIKHGTY